jgi:hypothetical protein
VKYVNVATQTVGFYPFDRMADYRDRLASGGAQRIVHLGEAGPAPSAIRTTPCIRCTASCTGWRTRTATRR